MRALRRSSWFPLIGMHDAKNTHVGRKEQVWQSWIKVDLPAEDMTLSRLPAPICHVEQRTYLNEVNL